jgi:16S rRNA (guanine527-N7)-methyltransferase
MTVLAPAKSKTSSTISAHMDGASIAELLEPFLDAELAPEQLNRISIYIDLLLRWNARINLSAVREPEQIVTRHFGESLFAARHVLPISGTTAACTEQSRGLPPVGASEASPQTRDPQCVVDLGSGAGFPGIPLKIWCPQIAVTLIESNHKKATFLREVIRALTLTSIDVFPNRAETYPRASASLVTLRAVERFDQILPVAQSLLAPAGRLALLIGESQAPIARQTLRSLAWSSPIPLPGSQSRALLVGTEGSGQ